MYSKILLVNIVLLPLISSDNTSYGNCNKIGQFSQDIASGCQCYYQCAPGFRLLRLCCVDGEAFDVYNNICNYKPQVTCNGVNPSFNCPQGNGTFANVDYCNEFWHCSNYIPYLKMCAEGTVWNDALKICDYPQSGIKCAIATVATEQTTSSEVSEASSVSGSAVTECSTTPQPNCVGYC